MIIIGNMKSLNTYYDELWFIMRSMDWYLYEKKKSLRFTQYDKSKPIEKNFRFIYENPNVKIINDLSPSKDLFKAFLGWKKEERWNEETFKYKYAPRFIKEIYDNEDARFRLNQLYNLDKQGKTVLLVCTCQEENLCHRSIIAGLLQGVGCTVQCQSDYRMFWEAYKKLKEVREFKNEN